MGLIPSITSQLNLVRNGDFQHYVNRTISAAPGAPIWQPLIAHWKLELGPPVPLVTTVAEEGVFFEDEPRRYLHTRPAEVSRQKIVSTDVYSRPSIRSSTATITFITIGLSPTITITPPPGFFDVSEPSPAPLSPVTVVSQVGDLIQVSNFSAPTASGTYRITKVLAGVATAEAISVPDPTAAGLGNSLIVTRQLDVHKIDLTLVYTIPPGQLPSHISPTIEVHREGAVAPVVISPEIITSAGDYEVVQLIGGTPAVQILHRFEAEFPRLPRHIELIITNTSGTERLVADVGLFVGNYHMPLSKLSPPLLGSMQDAVVPATDHLHLLAGRGDLILMRAGSQSPEGYKKLDEEIAFQDTTVAITYDASTDISTFVITDYRIPPDSLSGTFEMMFTDAPLVPANPGPLKMSIRMSDIEATDSKFGGAEIDLTGLLAGETVTLGHPDGVGGTTTTLFTEGVDFTDAATLAVAINDAASPTSPYLDATALVAVLTVKTDTSGWSNAQLASDGYLVFESVTGATWEQIGGGALVPAGQLNIPTSGIIASQFTKRGDFSARAGSTVLLVATAPIRVGATSDAGVLNKPSKTGESAATISATLLELDTSGVTVNDVLTFVNEFGDPLAPTAAQGPTYIITSVDLGENEITVQDINGAATQAQLYADDAENRYIIEKASDRHTHYGGQAGLSERDLESGGSNNNTARGNHGHQFFEDDAIPPYRKFIICEKL